ncbi:hypothetical protein GQ53DRAFT_823796 [Thozetella sp. PMI_491]|nr:hypothetical protein GQ53DRAFT_823796 [Thozetella sp. PMI_491]
MEAVCKSRDTLMRRLKHSITFILPKFVIIPCRRILHNSYSTAGPARRLSSTAYLDGLRGVAAFIVFICHSSNIWFPEIIFGCGVPGHNSSVFQLPFIRLLYAGTGSVCIFFVISGYVLSIKTLSHLYKGHREEIHKTLAASLFRRPFRLFLPLVVSTGFTALINQCFPAIFIEDRGPWPQTLGHVASSFYSQLGNWATACLAMINPFQNISGRIVFQNWYNPQLWTIPIELKGSLAVFTLLLVLTHTKRWIRVMTVAGAAYWQAMLPSGDCLQALFCIGLLFAELSLILQTKELQKALPPTYRHCLAVALVLGGLFLLSYPDVDGWKAHGFRTISTVTPEVYWTAPGGPQLYWLALGATIFMLGLVVSPASGGDEDEIPPSPLRRIFHTNAAQYLGEISYSLYAWHNILIHSVLVRFANPAQEAWQAAESQAAKLVSSGDIHAAETLRLQAKMSYFGCFIWGWIITAILALWVADFTNRVVDMNCVRFARKLTKLAWDE